MEQFESMRGFLEHVSLVMDAEQNADLDAVSIMTLHSAKGLEFDTVFLPGWEEGLFPHQRALDEGGRSGLEEERRLAYVGITRAKRRCHIWFVSNRRIHGLWQSTCPRASSTNCRRACRSRGGGQSYGGYGGRGGYGQSRFDKQEPFQNAYSTPGWRRAQANRTNATRDNWGSRSGHAVERVGYGESGPRPHDRRRAGGESRPTSEPSKFAVGDRVFHLKFGNGNVATIDRRQQADDRLRPRRPETRAGWVLGIDRSATAIQQAIRVSEYEMSSEILTFRQVAAEELTLHAGEGPFDLVLAVRVGALDGRHPEAGRRAMERIAVVLAPAGELWVDGQRRPISPDGLPSCPK
jgi:DNA helicase-2/ATP-dependent DNA helicase PcrA